MVEKECLAFIFTVRTMVLALQDIYAVRSQNEQCYSLKLTNIKTKLWKDPGDVDI